MRGLRRGGALPRVHWTSPRRQPSFAPQTPDERRPAMRRDMLLITLGAISLAAGSAQAHLWPDGTPLRVPAALDCPTVSGDMRRTAQAADGQSCDYASPRGETVRLRLVPLRGMTPSVALAPLREQL